jgi:hypothetical protein
MRTTAEEVIATFAVTSRARKVLLRWEQDPVRPHVPRTVLRHNTTVVYELSPAHVEEVCQASEHPLGNISKKTAMAVHPVVNWRPDFAFTYVMHLALETLGSLPTFQDFSRFCADDPMGRAALGDPARALRERATQSGYPAADVTQAIRWRIGLAYYSFVRELYTITVLRAAGLDARTHPLADALFRVDAWTRGTVISLYIRNPRFRDGFRGRKPRTQDILLGARPPFRYEELRLTTRHEFGCVHLPDPSEITAVASRLSSRRLEFF